MNLFYFACQKQEKKSRKKREKVRRKQEKETDDEETLFLCKLLFDKYVSDVLDETIV